ncbi:methyl-CpG-binding domain protein 5 isoform X1 [Triplophysa rosa]|nr:methyl-CpG-binding domain protein 5 isoform X1 [Triplophysa rosa]
MTGGSECAAGDKDEGTTIIAQVPVGWQRKAQEGPVSYISPSGTVLRSVDEVKVYLRTDGTCKCGLECPLVVNKVFNFDPAAMVQAPGHQSGKIEEDMTKLCNHRRKVDAMAALCQSMQPSQLPPTGGVVCSVDGRESRGSIAAHGESANCTYLQPRHNQVKSSNLPLTSHRSVLQNGSNSPLKKPSCQAPAGSNASSSTKQQWNLHPPLTPQNILQRTLHTPTSPNNNLLPNTFSNSPSTLIGRAAQQGGSVKSPSPLSVCSSPSRTLESFSPHQRSRHSSTSSLSEQGVKPSPPTMPCSSPKLPFSPTSPCSRLEGILQHYKDCSTSSSTKSTVTNNQSNHQMSQVASSARPNPADKRNGAAAQASNLLSRPLGQIRSRQKSQQHISNSFPASSLLSAAAKAQLANQKTLNTADALSALPLTGLDKEQQSKVLISTLNSNLHPTSARVQSLTTLLLPHSPSLSQKPPEKTLRRKRQRRSPTVLSMLKETQLRDLSTPPLLISPSHSPSSPPIPISDTHRLPVAPLNASFQNAALRLQEADESRKAGLCNSLPFSSPSPSQPLSALLQLLSMQSAQNTTQQSNNAASMPSNRHTHPSPSSPRPVTPQYDGQNALQVHIHTSQSQNSEASAQLPLTQFSLMGDETTMNLKTTSSNAVLNLSKSHTGMQSDLSGSVMSVINQMSSASCLTPQSDKGCGPKTPEMCPVNNTYQNQSNPNQAVESKSPLETPDQPDSETKLLSGCEPDHNLSLPGAPTTSEFSNHASDSTVSLPLAEAFPFMSQEQLLQLLTSNAGLPSLLPPFLGSLPLGIWTGQSSAPGGAQPQQAAGGILNQGSPLNMLSDLPLNLVSLPSSAGVDGAEKPPGLQALLMASLLLGQNPAAMLPLPPLNLELPAPQHQVFPEGISLEKTPALLDSVLMWPGLLEALQTLTPSVDGQSLLLSAPPPAFLSLNPALLAAALGQSEPIPNHMQSPPVHSQGTLSSPALVSTSVSCGPLVPPSGREVCDPLTEQDKNTQTPHFLPSLLGPGVLGDLTALGNINSLHSLLGAGPLLLPQGPSLGVPLTQNQTLNPLTCLQLTMGPTLMTEKPVSLHETPPSQEELTSAQISQDPLLNPVPAPAQQKEDSAGGGTGLFDPYGSFMDTIYTSFLQVSERTQSGSDSTPLSYPELPPLLQQTSAPPSLSPRRACSVHNPDLTRLGMETAQSPARGTPKLSPQDPSTPPPCKPAGVDALSDAPLQPAFMEEAKTDGSSKVCLYSNGISSGMERRGENDEDDVGQSQPGYLSTGERAVDDITSRNAEQERTEDMRTETRRSRKRKQTLQRGLDLPGGIDSIIEEPTATRTVSRPARSTRGKRRRVFR